MASHNISRPVRELAASNGAGLNKGFTLLETLVVMGIFIVLFGIGGVIGFNAYKGYLFRSERSTVVSVLERARSRAMANYNGKKHGVCYNETTFAYEIFEGPTCFPGSNDNEIIEGNPNTIVTGFTPIIFNQLSGNPTLSGSSVGCETGEQGIKINESGKESYVCINNSGRINW